MSVLPDRLDAELSLFSLAEFENTGISLDCLEGTFTGNPHVEWESRWFPVDFPVKTNPFRKHICVYIYIYT